MAFLQSLVKGKPKSPADLVRSTAEALEVLHKKKDQKSLDKATEELSRHLQVMRTLLYGEGDADPEPELVKQLAAEAQALDLMYWLVRCLGQLEFEARKHVAQIFNNLLRRHLCVTSTYLLNRPELTDLLISGYDTPEIALSTGSMLRECIGHEDYTRKLLADGSLYLLFPYAQVSQFDVAADAFSTIRELLTKHKHVCSEFLDKSYEQFFPKLESELLHSSSYVARRQSLKLLGEILLDRSNFHVMSRYINDPAHLRLVMNLLKDPSRSIQFEAFHVFKLCANGTTRMLYLTPSYTRQLAFGELCSRLTNPHQVFVANPNKTRGVKEILFTNKAKLVQFLDVFFTDKCLFSHCFTCKFCGHPLIHSNTADDEQFIEERHQISNTIKELELDG